MDPGNVQNIEILLETCLGTSNYPRVTIWGIGMAYFGQSVEEATKNRYWQDLGGEKKNSLMIKKIVVGGRVFIESDKNLISNVKNWYTGI